MFPILNPPPSSLPVPALWVVPVRNEKSGNKEYKKRLSASSVCRLASRMVSYVFLYPSWVLLSHFSHVRLCVTPETAAHQAPPPWDSPGKNTGVGCHFLLQCMEVKSESEVTQSSQTLSDPMDCSPPGSSVHGIFQARVLEWGAITFSGQKCALSFPTPRHLWSVGKKFSLDSCHSSMGNRYDNIHIPTCMYTQDS